MLMKNIYRLLRTLDFSEYGSFPDFEIYSIEGGKYDFTDNLGFPEDQDGVYIFLSKCKFPVFVQKKMSLLWEYKMLYCGKTKDLSTRFRDHNHKDDLKKYRHLYIAVTYCKNEREIDELEKRMLSTFRFRYNILNNDGKINKNIAGVKL